jgi:hypothetical protein
MRAVGLVRCGFEIGRRCWAYFPCFADFDALWRAPGRRLRLWSRERAGEGRKTHAGDAWALRAAISGPMPRMLMTRLRL